MRIAEFSESSKFWTHIALSGYTWEYVCISVCKTNLPFFLSVYQFGTSVQNMKCLVLWIKSFWIDTVFLYCFETQRFFASGLPSRMVGVICDDMKGQNLNLRYVFAGAEKFWLDKLLFIVGVVCCCEFVNCAEICNCVLLLLWMSNSAVKSRGKISFGNLYLLASRMQNLYLNWTWYQTRLPAEFKHITKRRKRN